MTIRVGPECGVDDGDVLFGNDFRIITISFVKTFFQSVIHGVDGGLSVFVSLESVEIGLLDEKE